MSSNTQSENEFSIEKEYVTTLALSKFKSVYQTYKYDFESNGFSLV